MSQPLQPQFGILKPFDGVDFTDYSERLNSYFVANNIGQVAADASDAAKREADERKVAVTISLIGKQTYSTLKDLCLPNLPAEKTYDQLIEILKGYYKPKVLEVAESYRFHHTLQSENETVTEYANKLKRLAVNFNFGTYLTRALRDQFVGGVKSQATKKKLLSEDRTFEQALKVAQADELAEKESKQLHSNSNLSAKVQAVHSVPKKSTPAHPVNKQQSATTGKTHAKFCFRCGSSQHLADKCSHSTSVCNFCKKKGHIAKVCFKKKKEGEKVMEFKIGDQLDSLLVRVVKGPSILGRDLMAKFKLPWQNIFQTVSTTTEDIVSQYPNLFDNTTVGKLKGIQVSLRVKEANPVFIKPRVVPFAIRSKYEEALEKLVAEDIIEKVEHSEWA
ncbi:uncharacterized protein [Montipora capricornis]|uniref:uncharacterized protein n=1 Tax=Montipora capricornis TaxID=246305 RepID=UPI0035F19943